MRAMSLVNLLNIFQEKNINCQPKLFSFRAVAKIFCFIKNTYEYVSGSIGTKNQSDKMTDLPKVKKSVYRVYFKMHFKETQIHSKIHG